MDVGMAFSRGFDRFKENAGVMIAATVILFVITLGVQFAMSLVMGLIQSAIQHIVVVLATQLVSYLVNTTVSVFLTLGMIRLSLNVLNQKPAEIGTLFGEGGKLIQGVLAQILVTLITVVVALPGVIVGVGIAVGAKAPEIGMLAGMVILLPVVIWLTCTLFFVQWLIVDADLDAIAAIKAAFDLSKGQRLTIFVLTLATGLLMLGGVLALCVGLLVAMPVAYLTWAAAFQQVRPSSGEMDASPEAM
jgi:hypothetical protein